MHTRRLARIGGPSLGSLSLGIAASLAGGAGCVPATGSFTIPYTTTDAGSGGTAAPPDAAPTDAATVDADTDTDTEPVTAATGDTGGTVASTGDTGEEPPPDPCLSVPASPGAAVWVPGVLGSEEFVFDATGYLYNLPDGQDAVFRYLEGGNPEFFAPFSAIEVAGIRVLLDGDLAVANEWSGSVERVSVATGGRSLLVGGLNSPNSLAVGPDGRLYVACYEQLVRVDIATGDVELLVDLPGADLDGLTFSPTYDRLYFNHDDGGEIGMLELAPDGTVTRQTTLVQLALGFSDQLDGMATDACGNLYVVRTDGEISRVDPSGVATSYVTSPAGAYTTALQFGSGVGGWQRDHLYLMDRDAGVVDLDVGVDGRPEPHLP